MLFSCQVGVWLFGSHGLQHARLPCPSPSPRVCPSSCPKNWWCHHQSHLLLPSSPAFDLSQHQGLFQWVNCLFQVPMFWSFNFSIRPSKEYSRLISFQGQLVWSPSFPRDSQETYPGPHVLSFHMIIKFFGKLFSPALYRSLFSFDFWHLSEDPGANLNYCYYLSKPGFEPKCPAEAWSYNRWMFREVRLPPLIAYALRAVNQGT